MAHAHRFGGPAVLGIFAALFATAAGAETGDPAAGRQKAAMCRACHGIDGVARVPNAATIAGETEFYLIKQLKAFRSGERKDPQMSVVAQPLSDEDIANLAAWFSSIKITVEVPGE